MASPLSPWLKRLLLGVLLLLLVLPALQAKFRFVAVRPLGGYEAPLTPPEFSREGLLDNTYQPAIEHYTEGHLGFREWLIRLRNQWCFSLLGKITEPTIGMGRNQQLYQFAAINAYLGRDFLGDEEIAFRVRRLRRLQDTLRAHGTQLLVVLAPGKARILPEFLPESYAQVLPTHPSNHDVLARRLPEAGVAVLDASQLLLRWKDTVRYPLFPRTGTHWSGYAVSLLADTLFRRAEVMTGHDLPDFRRHGGTVSRHIEELRFTDNDLGNILNLAHDIEPMPLYYPKVEFGPAQSKHRLDALIIGDSFAQSFYGFYPYYDRLLASRSRFWSYNLYTYWPEKTPESRVIHELNLREQYAGRDIVIILGTEQNLPQMGFGFLDDAFDLYIPRTAKDSLRTKELEQQILATPSWMDQVAQKAASKNIDILQAVHDDAQYMSDRER